MTLKKMSHKRLAGVFTACVLGVAACAFIAKQNEPPIRSNAQPVLILPGFFCGDFYMTEIHNAVSKNGYTAYGWNAGINLGPDAERAKQLKKRLQDISTAHNGQKVSIIGYSAGGTEARELARAMPDQVNIVITLGAPFGMRIDGKIDPRIYKIQSYYHNNHGDPRIAPPVPTISLYSTDDQIAGWKDSLNLPSVTAQNIRISGGHIAMPFNDAAIAVILDTIAQHNASLKLSNHPAPTTQ